MATDHYITDPITKEKLPVPQGITIRQGVDSDVESLRRLSRESDIFAGWDYLAGWWPEWVNDPRFLLAVADMDGEVVAFAGYRLTNKGQHVIGFGYRTHKDQRKRGLLKVCKAWRNAALCARPCLPNKELAAVGDIQYHMQLREQGKACFDVLYEAKYMFLALDLPPSDFKEAMGKLNSTEDRTVIEVNTCEELAHIFGDDAAVCSLFPTKHIILQQDAYEILPETASDIWHPRRKVHVTKEFERLDTLSIGTAFQCTFGTGYNIECCGSMQHSMQILHIQSHLQHIFKFQNVIGGNLVIFLSVPAKFDIENTYNMFRQGLKLSDGGIGIGRSMAMAYDLKLLE